MNPLIFFSTIVISILIEFLSKFIVNKSDRKNDTPKFEIELFSVSEYFERMDKASIDILEKQELIDKTIILWWGLDGLRLNEDGTLEWISRKKQNPVNQDISYQMCQSIKPLPQFDMAQSTQATREQIFSLKMQLDMANFNIELQQQMKCINSIIQNHSAMMFVGGTGCAGCGTVYYQPEYIKEIIKCCCDYWR